MAKYAVRDPDEALDIVQESMLGLVKNYANREAEDWPKLFFRILDSKIVDWHRRQAVRRKIFFWEGTDDDSLIEKAGDPSLDPSQRLQHTQTLVGLSHALDKLPLRQRQAFLLRNWEGLSTRDTAYAMSCSEGSVKTHFSRAMATLKAEVEDLSDG